MIEGVGLAFSVLGLGLRAWVSRAPGFAGHHGSPQKAFNCSSCDLGVAEKETPRRSQNNPPFGFRAFAKPLTLTTLKPKP